MRNIFRKSLIDSILTHLSEVVMAYSTNGILHLGFPDNKIT